MKKTVSLCMIVKNEEKTLARCLDSVVGKVEEIIIVDTGSEDNTIEIAKRYTSNIYSFQWTGSFAEARNFSIRQSSCDYILVMDADEYLDEDSDIHKVCVTGFDYYVLKIKNYLSFDQTFIHYNVRLFVNNENLYFENQLHEHLNIFDERFKFVGNDVDLLLHHTGYSNETIEEKDKLQRNLPIMIREVEENPNGFNLFNMGKLYLSLGQYHKAVNYFKKAYPLSKSTLYLPDLLTLFASTLGKLNRYEDGLSVINEAVRLYSEDSEMSYTQGQLFMEAGYLKDAELSFRKCLLMGDQGQGAMVYEGSGGYKARFMLAEVYERQRKLAESYELVIKVLEEKKTHIPALTKYFEIVSKANIPADDVYQNLELIYNVENINDLRNLIDTLYELRHPLLNEYIAKYKLQTQPYICAVASQYNKKYELARIQWSNISQLPDEVGGDLLLLAIILQDLSLFHRVRPLLNVSKKESETIVNLINREDNSTIRLTSHVEKLLFEVSRHLVILQEFDVFQVVLEFLYRGSVETKYNLCFFLAEYSFVEVAIDMLIKLYDEQPYNIKTITLLGDLCLHSGYIEDAHLFYSKLMDLKPDYNTYERCYDCYKKQGDIKAMNILKNEIKRKFPLVSWVDAS
ncbi:glycosyltransferase [Paenibacillus sp. FSL L8-0494]|uniref:glycosyltransferase n=1 Tax=Paenibacillus sp. FSL L8-0494 TaxID=2975352 RepID=UPI0030FACBDA